MAGRKWWKLVAVVGLGVLVARGGTCNRGCNTDATQPDEQLAGHFRALCTIARHGVDAPDDGVKQLFHYAGNHTPAMLADFGATLVLVERIDDDARHDDRARVARDRLHAPLLACHDTWQRFADAIEQDPVARQRLDRGVERLGRTLGILFGEDALRSVPTALASRVDAGLLPRASRNSLDVSPLR